MRKITREKTSENISFEELYRDFINSRIIKNVRPATITSYNKNIKNFQKWLSDNSINDVSVITKERVNEYMIHLQETQSNQSTINSYLRAVKAVLYYGMEEEELSLFRFSLPKEDIEVGETYSNDEIKLLIKKPNFKTCTDGEYKIWAVVNYMLETGNRLSTVLNIKVSDVNFDYNIVRTSHTKNRDNQFVPLTITLTKILKRYIQDFRLTKEDYLFPTVTAKAYTSSGLAHEIAKYNKSRGVSTTATHAFRRTFASNYVTSGGDSLNLKRLLGHKTLKMTERYLKTYDNTHMSDIESYSILKLHSNERLITRNK
ncbi:tyrosine-type recombinase/integrase [Proteiniclasticum sp.]|uniref:tyrosine-type recombinase/integrase n=1 Tax=Proteiniclasticum sp. TaxID=2053595 RepID=UPI0028997872|nr:tyrosine-type recombinase/integrase [Proteiniclasticum sp.]